MEARADAQLVLQQLREAQIQGEALLQSEQFVMCYSAPSSASSGAPNASDRALSSASETKPSTVGSSLCLSHRATASDTSPTRHKPQKPAISARPLVPSSSWVLAGLELSAEEMTGSQFSLASEIRETRGFAEDDDLILEPLAAQSNQSSRAASAITWAKSQTEGRDGVSDQPWRTLWPPLIGTPWFEEVAAQRPDVLYFSFDPENHLLHHHHPWQTWKSEPHAAATPLYDEYLDVSESESTLSEPDTDASRTASRHAASAATRRVIDALDDLIEVELQLPYVIPKKLNYLRPLRRYRYERPYRLQLPPDLVPMASTNVQAKSYHPVRIYDVSGHEDEFTLGESGFQYVRCPVPVGEWDEQAVTETYLPALLEWVVALLGGDSGLVYSFNFRHHSTDSFVRVQRPWGRRFNPLTTASADSMSTYPGNDDECYSLRRMMDANRRDDPFNAINEVEADPLGPCHWKQPLFRVHCDASEATHQHRLPLLRPDDADSLMNGRVREVSVWRKLSSHIQDTPLALCDARTVAPGDLVPMDVVYPHFADEVSEVRYNENHRWFYNKNMTTDDVAIFMLHDTHAKETVCPHSAFVDPSVPGDTPPRLSIEAKIMIFGGDVAPEHS